MLQLVPAVVGSGSLTLTLVAVPGPLLLTVITKPIGEPADTLGLSALLSMWIDGQSTLTSTGPTLVLGALLAWSSALLWYVAQLALLVAAVMCTLRLLL